MKKNLLSCILIICTLLTTSVSAQTTNDIRSKGSGFYSNIGVSVQPNITAIIDGTGKVTSFTVNSGGTFSLASGTINVYCTGGSGNGGYGNATLVGNTITTIALGNGGSGYTTAPTVVAAANSTTIWEKWTGSAWADVALGTAATSSAPTTTIQSGHVVTLTPSGVSSCNNLIIQSTAQLNTIPTASTGATATIRVGGTAPATAVITNDGIFGSAGGVNDGIIMEPNSTCASLTLTGSGSTIISRIRPTSPNLNSLVFNIDQNITLNYNNACFTAYYNTGTNTAAENVIFNINTGKVITIGNVSGSLHGAGTNPQGNVTYNINGTIDLGLTGTSNLIGSVNAGNTSNSKTTFNIGTTGKIITGTGLNISTVGGGTTAPVYFNVASGGIIDGTKLTTLTNATTPNTFVLSGTAKFIRTATTGVATTYPVSTSTSSYNPVTLTNAGTTSVVEVKIQSTFDNAPSDATKVVNRQWIITPSGAGANLTVALGWSTADQATSFNPANQVGISRYGTSWTPTAATVSGTSPYTASISGVTDFGNFIVENITTLPLEFLSFTANSSALGNAVNLKWKTANEVNTKYFEVQSRAANTEFKTIGMVNSKNTSGVQNYSYTDEKPIATTAYYRLKQIDKDGKFKFSEIASVNVKPSLTTSVFPNPVSTVLTVNHPASSTRLRVINLLGRRVIDQVIVANAISTDVNVTSLIPGIYIVVLDGQGLRSPIRFVKK